jgi:rhodanese-related sulfurtransferase
MKNITVIDLSTWLKNTTIDKPILLDVRESNEYEYCHIEGSLHIPMNTIPNKLLEIHTDSPIVCICHHGVRSMQVAMFLEQSGFTDISNLTGGVDAWAIDVDNDMPTY